MKSKTALVNPAENPHPMKEKFKNLIGISPTFLFLNIFIDYAITVVPFPVPYIS